MKIIEFPSHDILYASELVDMWRMSLGARNCTKSEAKMSQENNAKLLKQCLEQNPIHWSPFEHSSMTVRFICDRGVSHELVRHRLASFNQESTRYCNYSNGRFGSEITVVKPVKLHKDCLEYDIWKKSCEQAEKAYFDLLEQGVAPQNARAVLPTCLKTDIIVTANLREWYHIFELRDDRAAHPDMRFMMHDLLLDVANVYPIVFKDLMIERNKEFVEDFGHYEKKGEY